MPQMSPLSWLLLPSFIMLSIFIMNFTNSFNKNTFPMYYKSKTHLSVCYWMW